MAVENEKIDATLEEILLDTANVAEQTLDADIMASDIIRLGLGDDYQLSQDDVDLIIKQINIPTATKYKKGVVQVGKRLSIDKDGLLSADDEETLSNFEIEKLLQGMA